MLLSALTLAVLLQAAPAVSNVAISEVATQPLPKVRRSPRPPIDLVRGARNCGSNGLSGASHPEPLTAQPLSKLPKAHAERAVVRLVDGCPVAVLIAQRTPSR